MGVLRPQSFRGRGVWLRLHPLVWAPNESALLSLSMGVWAPHVSLPMQQNSAALPFCCPSALSASILGPPRVFDSFTFVPSVLAHIGVIRIFKSPLM